MKFDRDEHSFLVNSSTLNIRNDVFEQLSNFDDLGVPSQNHTFNNLEEHLEPSSSFKVMDRNDIKPLAIEEEIASTEELLASIGLNIQPSSRQRVVRSTSSEIGTPMVTDRIQSNRNHSIFNDPQSENDPRGDCVPLEWNSKNASNTSQHNAPSAPQTFHGQPPLSNNNQAITTDNLNVLVSSVDRLADIIEKSFLKLDRSIQSLMFETKRLNERFISLDEIRPPSAASNSQGASTPVHQPPPPPNDPRLRPSSTEQQTQRQTARGSLFAPPLSSHKNAKSPEHSSDSTRTADGRPSQLFGAREDPVGLPFVSDEEVRRRRPEEETKKGERERQKAAAEQQRRAHLEQRTRSFMSSLMPENGVNPNKPSLFDEEPSSTMNPHLSNAISGLQQHRNPLFDT